MSVAPLGVRSMAGSQAGKRVNVGQLVDRRVRQWEHTPSELALPIADEKPLWGPYVSISRAIGTHGRTISTRVAERLGWDYYEREIVEYIATRAKVREAAVKSLGETRRREVENWVRSMIDRSELPETAYVRHLVAVLTAIAAHGNAVILGRGAQFILPAEAGLRVRLYGPRGVRIRAAMESYGLSEREAEKLITDSDRSQTRFYRSRFKKDVHDPLSYDLLLNVAHLTTDSAAEAIICSLCGKLGRDICPGKPCR